MTEQPHRLLGKPKPGGLLIIGDHASNRVPSHIELGIDPASLHQHIAWDIGVDEVAAAIVHLTGSAAYLGNFSRLLVDLNRYADEPGAIPIASDGLSIGGNHLSEAARESRLAKYFHPYHDTLAEILRECRPHMILSLHSFTNQLETRPDEQRPWEVGVLYNQYEEASKVAIRYLQSLDLNVGDQLPYSGKQLNATMNRHAEGNGIPYIGIEMRQDMVVNAQGQERFAQILADMCRFVSEELGLTA
jgi:predicted N-formylglutamate amidohydrolase